MLNLASDPKEHLNLGLHIAHKPIISDCFLTISATPDVLNRCIPILNTSHGTTNTSLLVIVQSCQCGDCLNGQDTSQRMTPLARIPHCA